MENEKIFNISDKFSLLNNGSESKIKISKQFFNYYDEIIEMPENTFLILIGNEIKSNSSFKYYYLHTFDYFYLLNNKESKYIDKLLSLYLFNITFYKYNEYIVIGYNYLFIDRLKGKLLFVSNNIDKYTYDSHLFKNKINLVSTFYHNVNKNNKLDLYCIINNNIYNYININEIDTGTDILILSKYYIPSPSVPDVNLTNIFNVSDYLESYYNKYISSLNLTKSEIKRNSRICSIPLCNKYIDVLYKHDAFTNFSYDNNGLYYLDNIKDYFLPYFSCSPIYGRETVINMVFLDLWSGVGFTLIELLFKISALETFLSSGINLFNSSYNNIITGHFNIFSSLSSNYTDVVVSDVLFNVHHSAIFNKIFISHFENEMGFYHIFIYGDNILQLYENGNTTPKPICKIQQSFPEEYLFFDFPVYTKILIDWYDGYTTTNYRFGSIIGFCNFSINKNNIYEYNEGDVPLNKIYFFSDEESIDNRIEYKPLFDISSSVIVDDFNILNAETLDYNIHNFNNKIPLSLSINKPFFTTVYNKIIELINNTLTDKYNYKFVNNIAIEYLVSYILLNNLDVEFIEKICTKLMKKEYYAIVNILYFFTSETNNLARAKLFSILFNNKYDYTIKILNVKYNINYNIQFEKNINNQYEIKLGTARYPIYAVHKKTNEVVLLSDFNIDVGFNNIDEILSYDVNDAYLSYMKITGEKDNLWFYFYKYIYNYYKDENGIYVMDKYTTNENSFIKLNNDKYIKYISDFSKFVNSKIFKKYFKKV